MPANLTEHDYSPPEQPMDAVTMDDPVAKQWFETANRMKMMKEAGYPADLKSFEEMPDPAECGCGKPFFAIDDYLCPNCRAAFDEIRCECGRSVARDDYMCTSCREALDA